MTLVLIIREDNEAKKNKNYQNMTMDPKEWQNATETNSCIKNVIERQRLKEKIMDDKGLLY